jgi:hypothetical protein
MEWKRPLSKQRLQGTWLASAPAVPYCGVFKRLVKLINAFGELSSAHGLLSSIS